MRNLLINLLREWICKTLRKRYNFTKLNAGEQNSQNLSQREFVFSKCHRMIVFSKIEFRILKFSHYFHASRCGGIIPARAGHLWWVGTTIVGQTRLKSEIKLKKGFILNFFTTKAKERSWYVFHSFSILLSLKV